MNRCSFIEIGVVSGTAMGVLPAMNCQHGLPKQILGKSGEKLSVIGFSRILEKDMDAENGILSGAICKRRKNSKKIESKHHRLVWPS
jgi:hypothetical protein